MPHFLLALTYVCVHACLNLSRGSIYKEGGNEIWKFDKRFYTAPVDALKVSTCAHTNLRTQGIMCTARLSEPGEACLSSDGSTDTRFCKACQEVLGLGLVNGAAVLILGSGLHACLPPLSLLRLHGRDCVRMTYLHCGKCAAPAWKGLMAA